MIAQRAMLQLHLSRPTCWRLTSPRAASASHGTLPYPPHGVLDHYRLRFWRGNDTAKATEITVAHDECPRRRRFIARHCFTVKGLERSSVYHFSVRAKNKGSSFSPYSMQLVVKTNDS
ncbi:hypothetical protein MTO96_032668, partial [Rhipicephalus appendiculatus]